MAERPYPSYFIYVDAAGEYRWRCQASNTKIIADSGEGYKKYSDCKHGITLMQGSSQKPIWRSAQAAEGDK